MKKVLLLLLVATTVLSVGCKKTIKVKRLVGEWTVSAYETSSVEERTVTTSYNRSECEPNSFDPTDTESEEVTRVNNGGTETVTYNSTDNGDFEGTTATGNVSIKLNIKDDGTYDVTGTYSYTYRGPNGNNPATQFSGTIASAGNNWYLLDSDKKNAAVQFIDFPFFLNAQFSGSSIAFGSGDITFDIDESDKDKITFVRTSDVTTVDTVVDPPVDFPEDDCIKTRVVEERNTESFSITLTQ